LGIPGPIRTADLPLRRRLLYPSELRGHGDDHWSFGLTGTRKPRLVRGPERRWKEVELRGFEPLTSAMRTRRSPN
jgi:hypothetical protein